MTREELDELRRLLRLRMRHAFGHSYQGAGQFGHAEANIEGFMRELERFIDAKVADEVRRKTTR